MAIGPIVPPSESSRWCDFDLVVPRPSASAALADLWAGRQAGRQAGKMGVEGENDDMWAGYCEGRATRRRILLIDSCDEFRQVAVGVA